MTVSSVGPPGSSCSSSNVKKEEGKELKDAKTSAAAAAAAAATVAGSRRLPAEFVDSPRGWVTASPHLIYPPPFPFSSSSLYPKPISATLPAASAAFASAAAAAAGGKTNSKHIRQVHSPLASPTATARVSLQPAPLSPRLLRTERYHQVSTKWVGAAPSPRHVFISPPPATTRGAAGAAKPHVGPLPSSFLSSSTTLPSPTFAAATGGGGGKPTCPLELPASPLSSWGYRFIQSPPHETRTVATLRLPPHTAPAVLPMKEVNRCTEMHGWQRQPTQPSITTYIIADSPHVRPRRRSVYVGRRRGICEDLVLPCIDGFLDVLSRVCSCGESFPASSPPAAVVYPHQQPAAGDFVCLRCGAEVSANAVTSTHPAAAATGLNIPSIQSKQNTQTQKNTDGRIPLPTFPYAATSSQSELRRKPEKKGGSNSAVRTGRLRSSALGFPTDDEGLVALPAFSLGGASSKY